MKKITGFISFLRNEFLNFLFNNNTIFVSIVLISSLVIGKIVKQVLVAVKKRIQGSTLAKELKVQQYIFSKLKLERFSIFVYVASCIILKNKFEGDDHYYISQSFSTVATLLTIYIITRFLHEIFDGLALYTESKEEFRGRSYRSYIQVLILIVYIAAFVIGAGSVSGKSPWDLLSGIGAMTAVLLLVFRETILSFVSSLQISSYDLVRLGDWISVPRYDADGDVIEVALHTIKIQNWDKTISVLPTHEILQSGFKNWRGMTEIGGRRIKRSIFLDSHSVKFMDKTLRERLGEFALLKDYFEKMEKDGNVQYEDGGKYKLDKKYLTNIGTFRIYVLQYLKASSEIRQDLTLLVRQLESGPTGIPLELYLFTATTAWAEYETIQADIFDHLFAILPAFELKTFQYNNMVIDKK